MTDIDENEMVFVVNKGNLEELLSRVYNLILQDTLHAYNETIIDIVCM